MRETDLADAGQIVSKAFSTATFIPPTHIKALETYFATLIPPTHHPITNLHTTLVSIHSTLIALLLSLARPTQLISTINQHNRSLSRNYVALSKSTRWPLGLLDDTRQRLDREKRVVVEKEEREKEGLERELRYSQQVVAGELAGWQEWKVKREREVVRELARGMVVLEKQRLDGMRRALRALRPEGPEIVKGEVFEERVMRERVASGRQN